jgi:hypothetical protein
MTPRGENSKGLLVVLHQHAEALISAPQKRVLPTNLGPVPQQFHVYSVFALPGKSLLLLVGRYGKPQLARTTGACMYHHRLNNLG